MSDFKTAEKQQAFQALKKMQDYAVEQDDQRPLGSRWVNMSNALARASHNLPLSSKRIVAIAVAKLDSVKKFTDWTEYVTKVRADEYAEEFGLTLHKAYAQLKEGADALFEAEIKFFEPSKARKGRPLEGTVVRRRWVQEAKYHQGEAWVSVMWTTWLEKHLTELREQFTTYQLKQTTALRSIYAWRLLEMFSSWKTGIMKVSLEDFCEAMDATEKQRSHFGQLRIRVIEPAVRELVEKDGWIVEWNPLKTGRTTTALEFRFKRDPQGQLFN